MGVLKVWDGAQYVPVVGPAPQYGSIGATVRRATAQSINSSADTLLSFSAADTDTHGFWSAGAPTRLTIPAGMPTGLYLLTCTIHWPDTSATGYRSARWFKNGTTVGPNDASNGANLKGASPSQVVSGAPGDYFTINLYQTQGSAQNVGGANIHEQVVASIAFIGSQAGPAGAVGATGPAGADGATGPQGPQGIPGVDSTGLSAPTGGIMPFAGVAAPSGWLLCDGAAVSRATYSALFALVSTTYGVGDGSTTFNVPNLKGRVVVGVDAAQTEFDVRGETGGAKTHTMTNNHSGGAVNDLPPNASGGSSGHTHGIPGNTELVGAMSPGGSNAVVGAHSHTGNTYGESGHTHSIGHAHSFTQPSAHGAVATLPPYMALPYIIKT